MTPKEKARWIVDHYRHIGPEDSQAIMSDIEAAIEEDRKARECCKAEREACAGIVEEEYRQSLLRNDPNPGIDPLLTATKIRARKSKGD